MLLYFSFLTVKFKMSGLKKKMADYFIHNRDVVKKKKIPA